MACHGIFAKRKVAPELMMQVTRQRDFHAFRAIQKLCNHAVNYWAAERTGEENLFMTGSYIYMRFVPTCILSLVILKSSCRDAFSHIAPNLCRRQSYGPHMLVE